MEEIGCVLKLGRSEGVQAQSCALKGLVQYVIRATKKTKKSKDPNAPRTETLAKLKAT